ncbi:60S ribosomal protein L9 [Trebouxia sp. C0009 RCD-2024]
MKLVKASQDIVIPDDVKMEVKARKIRVTGPRGTLTRDFKHLAVDMYKTQDDIQPEDEEGEVTKGPLKLRVDCHFGKRKRLAAIRTCTSHVQNMIKGVTKGFEYKMRLVYAHFPINANITDEGGIVEVRNFLGEKRVRIVKMLPGVKVVRSTNVKDELVISGSDIELVSKSAALINMSCHVKKKDIRKFLDGVYVSEKGSIVKDD